MRKLWNVVTAPVVFVLFAILLVLFGWNTDNGGTR